MVTLSPTRLVGALVGALTTVTASALLAAPALAAVGPGDLAGSDVVVEDGSGLAAADSQRLSEAAARLRQEGAPTKFVVLAQRPPDPPRFAQELRRASGFAGNLLVLVPSSRSLGIGSDWPTTEINAAFEAERSALTGDPVGGTIAVADRLAALGTPTAAPGGPPAGSRSEQTGDGRASEGGGSGGGGLLVLAGVGLAGGALLVVGSRARAKRRLAEEKAALEPLLDGLACQVTELGPEVEVSPDQSRQVTAAYDEAVLAYGEARDGWEAAASPAQLAELRAILERGLRAAQRARALLDGRDPDASSPALLEGLCAFDPKHGRATTRHTIATPSGDDAEVPVCSSCAAGLERGEQPRIRQVPEHGRPVPYWHGAGLSGFGAGLFPAFGGILGGMLLYDLLTPDLAYGAGSSGTEEAGGFDGGGDIGGFGGGDFGGGDFGGGDFGGGGDF